MHVFIMFIIFGLVLTGTGLFNMGNSIRYKMVGIETSAHIKPVKDTSYTDNGTRYQRVKYVWNDNGKSCYNYTTVETEMIPKNNRMQIIYISGPENWQGYTESQLKSQYRFKGIAMALFGLAFTGLTLFITFHGLKNGDAIQMSEEFASANNSCGYDFYL
ncbi:MAG: hypothetical protein HRT89_06695 [Lentisphaeria bacterium]|nr:hypothetical protein [Lentisphaeria bacterium]NQZ67742.1 hypothetical protein [Lentisphaeria bacterium]